MGIDLGIVLIYFIIIFAMAMTGRQGKDATKEEYFLSNNKLK